MTKTEYLFGHKKEKYENIPFPEIGHIRIKDAEELMTRLRKELSGEQQFDTKKRERLYSAFKAKATWRKILEIEE